MTSRAVSARATACAATVRAHLPRPPWGLLHPSGRVLCSARLLWDGSTGQRKAGATKRRCGPGEGGSQGGPPMTYRCAILDDYQNVALGYADWSSLGPEVDVKVFNQPFRSSEEVHRTLQGFHIICMMRERTAF